ncbi:MAG: chloride channel protein [Bacteroidetes bacterium]|nr:chloride channel protein [Bacteroidota bacterium]
MQKTSLLGRFLIWRLKHISNKNFVRILSVFVGLASGFAAVLLKTLAHYIHQFLTSEFNLEIQHFQYLAYPLIGILITVILIKYVFKKELGHGVTDILYSISKRKSIIPRSKSYTSILGSSITVGFGGSVGLEAPAASTGSAIGSNLARVFHLDYQSRTLLIGCGAAGAISAIFNAPITGVIFALEILMLDLTMASLIPLLMATVSGALFSQYLIGKEIMFSYTLKESILSMPDIGLSQILLGLGFYVMLGLTCGIISVYFTRTELYVENLMGKIKNVFTKLFLGGIAIGVLIFVFPPLYGEGYHVISTLLNGEASELMNNSLFYSLKDSIPVFLLFLVGVMMLKVVATAITIGSGGVGGIFAPSLFVGGITGFIFARVVNNFNPPVQLSESNFTMVGMAGMLSGVLHAPLTGIFLIAEITGGYELILPLMLVSVSSYLTIMAFEPHSIYTKKLAAKGELIGFDKDKAILTLIGLKEVIEKDLKTINPDATLGDLVKVVAVSNRNIFPVIDEDERLLGIVLLDDIRDIMFNPKMYNKIKVRELMHVQPASISSDDSMDAAMKKFEETGAWNLPVIDKDKYVGFVSKSKLFSAYRRMLKQFSP